MSLRKPLSALAFGLVTVLVVTGCTVMEEQEAAPQDETAVEQAPEMPENPPSSPAMPYSGVAVLPPVNDDPQQLMGLDREELNETLGEPALVRREGDAEIWQYRADRCVLDLFLYAPAKRVEHIDLRNRGAGDEAEVRDCFVGMLRAAMPST